jgi:hypothetical protein
MIPKTCLLLSCVWLGKGLIGLILMVGHTTVKSQAKSNQILKKHEDCTRSIESCQTDILNLHQWHEKENVSSQGWCSSPRCPVYCTPGTWHNQPDIEDLLYGLTVSALLSGMVAAMDAVSPWMGDWHIQCTQRPYSQGVAGSRVITYKFNRSRELS